MINSRDANIEDIASIKDHLIPKDESIHFSRECLFPRIRGYAIIKPINGSIDRNHINSHNTATAIPMGIARRMPVNIIANTRCLMNIVKSFQSMFLSLISIR